MNYLLRIRIYWSYLIKQRLSGPDLIQMGIVRVGIYRLGIDLGGLCGWEFIGLKFIQVEFYLGWS